jgi:hypothetical protein
VATCRRRPRVEAISGGGPDEAWATWTWAACSQVAQRGLMVRPGNGGGSAERLYIRMAGWPSASSSVTRRRGQAHLRSAQNHSTPSSRRAWKSRSCPMVSPFRGDGREVYHQWSRQAIYPQDRGTRPRRLAIGVSHLTPSFRKGESTPRAEKNQDGTKADRTPPRTLMYPAFEIFFLTTIR